MRNISFSANNHITLLCSGRDYFPALIAAINAAQSELFLETYLFSRDATAQRVAHALSTAARRGVDVKVMTDWFGTGRAQSKRLTQDWLAPPVSHRLFNHGFRRGFARTHRKMCVVDKKVAFVGGLNMNDDLLSDDGRERPLPAARWDFAVHIHRGPLIDHIYNELERQWLRLDGMHWLDRFHNFRRSLPSLKTQAPLPIVASLVVRDNLRHRRTIARTFMQALGRAVDSVLLANPYFAPGRKLRQALIEAALRGVKVTLLLGVGRYWLQDAVTRSYYPKLMRAGIHIVEYKKTDLHAKVAVIDDAWASVGSSNFDGFSLLLNHEANVIIKDPQFSRLLRVQIEQGIADGVSLTAEDFIGAPWYQRAWYGLAFLGYRLVMRLFSIGNKG